MERAEGLQEAAKAWQALMAELCEVCCDEFGAATAFALPGEPAARCEFAQNIAQNASVLKHVGFYDAIGAKFVNLSLLPAVESAISEFIAAARANFDASLISTSEIWANYSKTEFMPIPCSGDVNSPEFKLLQRIVAHPEPDSQLGLLSDLASLVSMDKSAGVADVAMGKLKMDKLRRSAASLAIEVMKGRMKPNIVLGPGPTPLHHGIEQMQANPNTMPPPQGLRPPCQGVPFVFAFG